MESPSASLPSYNWSVKAIPAAFMFGMIPHGYYVVRLMAATKGKMSSAMPRTNLDTWKGKLPAEVWNQIARARGAHINCMEVFPLFAAAVIAGNAAKLPAQDMNNMAWSFFAARTLYLGLYLTIKNDVAAYARSGAYAWSVSIPLVCLWKAGNAFAKQ